MGFAGGSRESRGLFPQESQVAWQRRGGPLDKRDCQWREGVYPAKGGTVERGGEAKHTASGNRGKWSRVGTWDPGGRELAWLGHENSTWHIVSSH